MTTKDECPFNGCDLRAGQIPEEYLAKGYYGPRIPGDGPQYYNRLVGVEIRGVYDGVLYWQCPDCGVAWHRFTEYMDYMRPLAQPYIDKANASVTPRERTTA